MDRPTVWPDVTQHSQALSLSNLTSLLRQNEPLIKASKDIDYGKLPIANRPFGKQKPL